MSVMNGSVVNAASTFPLASAAGAAGKGIATSVTEPALTPYGLPRMSRDSCGKLKTPAEGTESFLPFRSARELIFEFFATMKSNRPGEVCTLSATIRRFRLGNAFSCWNIPT